MRAIVTCNMIFGCNIRVCDATCSMQRRNIQTQHATNGNTNVTQLSGSVRYNIAS